MILKWFKDLDPSKQIWQHAVHWGGVIVQLFQLRDNPTSSSITKVHTVCEYKLYVPAHTHKLWR